MILIVSAADDPHARAVAGALRARRQAVSIFDQRELGAGASLCHAPGDGEARLRTAGGEEVDLSRVRAVWYRRPWLPPLELGGLSPEDRAFAQQEWQHALDALFARLEARFVNPPAAQRAATKPRQLALARRVGLAVPDTLISNDPGTVETFVRRHRGAVVHKALTAPRHRLLDTRRFDREARQALPELPLAPAIFQQEIAGPADLRVTAVGDRLFAARIETARGRADIDSRLDADAPCEQADLPSRMAHRLLALMRALGLVFATVDLKIPDRGEPVFLEVNPQGQFLYIEILTGLPLIAAVAELLADG